MKVKAVVAEDDWRRVPIPLIDWQVRSPDEDRKFVRRSGPRFPMDSGQERRIDPMELVHHPMDDRASWTRKLREQGRQEMTGPSIIYSV
jgi:hypothetical protein